MRFTRLLKGRFQRVLFFLAIIGPGLITASADNDAPGIATYSMAGSYFGYGFLWIITFITLGESLALEMAARMGAVTGKDLTDLIRERFGLRLTMFIMVALWLANMGTTAAQFAGVASSGELFGVSRYFTVPVAVGLVWLLVTRGSYRHVEKVLLALSAYAFAYIITAIKINPPWLEIGKAALVPSFRLETHYLLAVLATIGTTITPWAMVYMQASVADKGVTILNYKDTRLDVMVGTIFGNLVSAFIVICTAATLYSAGIRVDSAEEAAMALTPLVGPWARVLFGAGLMGASLLAASVLPLSTTYAVCEIFGWERGLDRSPDEAPVFYGLYTTLVVLSGLIVLIPGLPLFPFMWLSQVANSVLLPTVLVLMLILINDRLIMNGWVNKRLGNIAVGVLAALVTIATLALFISGGSAA